MTSLARRLTPFLVLTVGTLWGCAPAELEPEPGEVCLDVIGTVPEYCDPNVCVDDPIELVQPAAGDPITPLVEYRYNPSDDPTLLGYLDADGSAQDPRVALDFGPSVQTDSSSANLLAELQRFMIIAEVPTRTRELKLTSLPTAVEHMEVIDGVLHIRGQTPLANLLYPSGIQDLECSSSVVPQLAQCNCVYERDVVEMRYELRFLWPY